MKVLKQEQQNAHDQVLLIASKHIAHRVIDGHEAAGVRALLAPPPQPREVVGIVSALGHVSEPPGHLPELLLQLCDAFLEKVTVIKDELTDATLESLRQQDIDALYGAAVGPIPLPEDQSKVVSGREADD
jgi:hypothetical protein